MRLPAAPVPAVLPAVDLPEATMSRYVAAPYDHGFVKPGAVGFDGLDEALVYAAQRGRTENGRVTSHTGRNVRDITWMVKDTETGEYHLPGPEHFGAGTCPDCGRAGEHGHPLLDFVLPDRKTA